MPIFKLDYSGMDLRHRDFSNRDLTGANFHGANLRGADFKNSICIGANFYDAWLQGADLRGADFHKALLSKADFNNAFIEKTTLPAEMIFTHIDDLQARYLLNNLAKCIMNSKNTSEKTKQGMHLIAYHFNIGV